MIPTVEVWPDLDRALAREGWAHHPAFLSAEEVARVRAWGHAHAHRWQLAGTGRAHTFRARSVRGDRIVWLDPDAPNADEAERLVGARLAAVRRQLNRTAFLNLADEEAHLAVYPSGAGYARHVDRFRDTDRRVVSVVVYLNDGWRPEDGGALRLHAADGPIDLVPHAGHAVAFLSDDMEHEVLPARRERWSVAAWLRRSERVVG